MEKASTEPSGLPVVPTLPNWSYDDHDLCCQFQSGTVFFEVPRCQLFANESPPGQVTALLKRMKRGQNTNWLTLDNGDIPLISCQVQDKMLAINFEGQNDCRYECELVVSMDAAQKLLDDLIRLIGN